MSSAAFSGLPMVINCQTHNHLRHYLDRALQILDPEIVGGLNLLPSACAMGTVTMSSTRKITPCHRSCTWTASSREPYTLARPCQIDLPTAFHLRTHRLLCTMIWHMQTTEAGLKYSAGWKKERYILTVILVWMLG